MIHICIYMYARRLHHRCDVERVVGKIEQKSMDKHRKIERVNDVTKDA